MAVESAKYYKEFQKLIGPSADWLDASIGFTLTKIRAHAAASIVNVLPRCTART
jgi:hypothetical protein